MTAASSPKIAPEGLPVDVDAGDLARTGDRPNILLICCDQLRYDYLGCNGNRLVQTPQMDQLSAAGINFQRAMSECPVCVPARRILMTGRNPYGVDMIMNRDVQPFPQGPKLAEVLSEAGYHTHATGKMHTWPPRNRMGFHDIEVNEEGRTAGLKHPDDYTQFLMDEGLGPQAYAHGMGNNQYGARLSPVPEYATTTGWTADRAMRFLRRRDPGKPFFLYVSFDKPHPPLTPPEEFYELYRDTDFPAPVLGDWCDKKSTSKRESSGRGHNYHLWRDNEPMVQQSKRAYAALISHIDSRIGQLLGTVREQGLSDNTWVILVADHGEHLFDHDLFAKGNFLATSARVPFIVVPPEKVARELPTGRLSTPNVRTPAGLIDIMPTLLDIAGAPIPEDIDGQSLLPHFHEDEPSFRPYNFGRCQRNYGVTDGRFRLTWDGADGDFMLFDQDEDPVDLHDLADDPAYAEIRQRLVDALLDWLQRHGDDAVGPDGTFVTHPPKPARHPDRTNHWNNRGWR